MRCNAPQIVFSQYIFKNSFASADCCYEPNSQSLIPHLSDPLSPAIPASRSLHLLLPHNLSPLILSSISKRPAQNLPITPYLSARLPSASNISIAHLTAYPAHQTSPSSAEGGSMGLLHLNVNGPVIVEDTCLCFNALNGLPGPYM